MKTLLNLASATVEATQKRAARKAELFAKRAVLFALAGVLALMAVIYFSVAAYTAFSLAFGPVAAGLWIGGILLVIAGLLILIAVLLIREKKTAPIRQQVAPEEQALLAMLNENKELKPYMPLIALALGVFAGRR